MGKTGEHFSVGNKKCIHGLRHRLTKRDEKCPKRNRSAVGGERLTVFFFSMLKTPADAGHWKPFVVKSPCIELCL